MKILFIDNNSKRHDKHQSFINNNPKVTFDLKIGYELDELKEKEEFDIYIIHRGNVVEYNFVYNNTLGKQRIFFSGGERNPGKNSKGIFTDIENLYKEIENVILQNC